MKKKYLFAAVTGSMLGSLCSDLDSIWITLAICLPLLLLFLVVYDKLPE